jgi:hypothetical protein
VRKEEREKKRRERREIFGVFEASVQLEVSAPLIVHLGLLNKEACLKLSLPVNSKLEVVINL